MAPRRAQPFDVSSVAMSPEQEPGCSEASSTFMSPPRASQDANPDGAGLCWAETMLEGSLKETQPATELDLKIAQQELDNTMADEDAKGTSPGGDRPQVGRLEQQLQDAVGTGKFDLNSALGQRFRREFANDPTYKSCTRTVDKQAFRIKWAQRQYAQIRLSKSKIESFEDEMINHGEYKALPAIVVAEGGYDDKSNLAAAVTYCRKCVTMGGKWVKKNTWTNRTEYLYMKEGSCRIWMETGR